MGDETSPNGSNESPNEFRRETEPNSASSGNARNETFTDQNNWMPLPDHAPTNSNRDVHRTLQELAINENRRSATYRSGNMNSYGNSESSNGAGLSPDTANSSSNRPTPNASTPSDSRPNLQNGQSNSGAASYEASPASSHQNRPAANSRAMSSFFSTQPDYSNIPATDMTPDNTFSMPDTPGRGFDVPSGWEMSNQATTGLTPVGEGVFRQLLGLGPMDAM